jgi:hypothetical protein
MPTGTAIFMGAGASKPFGYPLTSEILPLIREKLGTGELFGNEERAAEKKLEAYLRDMLPGWDDPKVATPPITDVLSLLDYSSISQTAPLLGTSTTRLLLFRRLLERAIYEVIYDAYRGKATHDLKRFITFLLRAPNPIGILTTNYDIEVETALFRRLSYKKIETGFDWREPYGAAEKFYTRPSNALFRFL